MQGQSKARSLDRAGGLRLPLRERPVLLTAVVESSALPPDHGREVAFAGRSNAGKSSAINAITGCAGLARTSKTPGRTRALLFFGIAPERRIVDLPGYGHAAVPEPVRVGWRALLTRYLARRHSLVGIFLISDARHPITDLDLEFLSEALACGRPCHVLLSKADKLSRSGWLRAAEQARARLSGLPVEVGVSPFSAHAGLGLSEARGRLLAWLS
ncbi:MAG: putative GTP-binding protein EngB [Lysobacterales bacterium]|nr:MAG: putative GTP-binding protein EngB [Xanthomonadales bacterium]